jgi:hypothetical protein
MSMDESKPHRKTEWGSIGPTAEGVDPLPANGKSTMFRRFSYNETTISE